MCCELSCLDSLLTYLYNVLGLLSEHQFTVNKRACTCVEALAFRAWKHKEDNQPLVGVFYPSLPDVSRTVGSEWPVPALVSCFSADSAC